MSSEEAESVNPSRYLSLILVFFQISPLGEATVVSLEKDKQTTSSSTHLSVSSCYSVDKGKTKPLSMAFKALHSPTSLSSNISTYPPSPSLSLSCLPQGLCICCLRYLLSSSALFHANWQPWQYAIWPEYCGGHSFCALNLLYLCKGQLLGHKLPDCEGVSAHFEPGCGRLPQALAGEPKCPFTHLGPTKAYSWSSPLLSFPLCKPQG